MAPAPLLEAVPDLPAASLRLQYQLKSNGAVIGSIEAGRARVARAGAPLLALTYKVRIRSAGIWSDYTLDADEEITIDADGLCRYENTAHEDGEPSSISGVRADDVMTLRIDDRKLRICTFGQADYDATSEDAPALFLAGGRDAAVLRVLDLEHGDIDEISYRRLPDQTLTLPGGARQTRVLSFTSSRRKLSARQWYVSDATGEVLVHEHSEEPGERNEAVLIEWTMGSVGNA